MNTITHQISLNSSTITCVLAIAAFLLIAASVTGQISQFMFGADSFKLIRLFNVDEERNIPTYFTMLLMMIIVALLALITILNSKLKSPYMAQWLALFFGFLYMAYDEIFSLHEKLIGPVQLILGEDNLGVFYFAWVVPGIMVVILTGLFLLKFLLYLPTPVRLRFLFAATIYLAGAIGLELVGELHGEENLTYSMITTIEESLEISGLIFFIWALLKYCEEHYQEVQLRFTAQSLRV